MRTDITKAILFHLFFLLIVILTIYPVAELTCAINDIEIFNNSHPATPHVLFYWEIGLMWAGYVVAMGLVYLSLVVNYLRR